MEINIPFDAGEFYEEFSNERERGRASLLPSY
jgi:hypothetical protein